jgi:pimeloyl-ACP methyl ester carboxylesterase
MEISPILDSSTLKQEPFMSTVNVISKTAVLETSIPEVIWLNTSFALQCFAQPLLEQLSEQANVTQWQYHPQLDEDCSLEQAILRLHDYLKTLPHPAHLIGHSTSGLLGLLYARVYPEQVKSLSLLAVGVDIAVDWQFLYYQHRWQLSPDELLSSMVYNLFGYQNQRNLDCLITLLKHDLIYSLSPHSLFRQVHLLPYEVAIPLLVCGSQDDIVVDDQDLQAWGAFLKPGDRLWSCLDGGHFFHCSQAPALAEQLVDFWQDSKHSQLGAPLTSAVIS